MNRRSLFGRAAAAIAAIAVSDVPRGLTSRPSTSPLPLPSTPVPVRRVAYYLPATEEMLADLDARFRQAVLDHMVDDHGHSR